VAARTYPLIAAALGLALSQAGCSTFSFTKAATPIGASSPMAEPSMAARMGSSIKSSAGAMAAFVTPKPSKASKYDEPVKPIKVDSHLYVTMARLQEQAGQLDKAAAEYEKALKHDKNDLTALVGYAHLQDRRGDLEGATKLYERAIAAHPKEAGPQNDLALCFHRRGMLPDAARLLSRAVELQPDRKLYRNNFAIVLVDMGNTNAAITQLTAAHGPAVANYNLGCLLARKGDRGRALESFQRALAYDPSLAEAQDWIAKLNPPGVPQAPQMTRESPVVVPTAAVTQQAASPATYAAPSWTPVPQPAPQIAPEPGPAPAYLQTQLAAAGQPREPIQHVARNYSPHLPSNNAVQRQTEARQRPPLPNGYQPESNGDVPAPTIVR